MIVEVDRAAGVVTKRASTPAEAERLRREVSVLRVARHPGVVELVDSGDDWVSMRLVEGGEAPATTEVACVVATTIADLHDIGVVYGNSLDGHILLDGHGEPVLCSPGRDVSAGPAGDVAALASYFAPRLPVVPPALARAEHVNSRRRPSARAVANALAGRDDRRPGRWVAAGLAFVVALVLVVVLARPSAGRRAPTVALAQPGGIVLTASGRYRIGDAQDVVILGHWSCSPAALPALLQRATGEVWVFDRWSAGAGDDVTARFVTWAPDATSLLVRAARPGCDRLLVRRRAGPAVAVLPN